MQTNRIILDMPAEEYHRHDSISKSGLDQIDKSGAHYLHYRKNGAPKKEVLDFGTAFHTLVLEPHKFDESVVIWSGAARNTKAGKDEYASAARYAGKRPLIRESEYAEMKAMCPAIHEHVSARVLLGGKGKVESSLFWIDEITGVECRIRPDWLRDDGMIVDLKTARTANPDDFPRDAFNHRYHVTAAFYMDGYKAVTGEDAAGYAFVAGEKEAPHGVGVYVADEQFVELGRKIYRRNLERYATCRKNNVWPKYPDIPLTLRLPVWAERQLNEGVSYV